MLSTAQRIQAKSFYYLLASKRVGYYAYTTTDPTKVLIGHLICAKCHRNWNNGWYECYFCGAPNYHLYTCIACGGKTSITNAGNKCPYCNRRGTLRQLCLNPKCPTNNPNNAFLYSLARVGTNKSGGIFHRASKNQMRLNSCKYCGCTKCVYVTTEIQLVFNPKDLIVNNCHGFNRVYMDRLGNYLKPIRKYYLYNQNLDQPKIFTKVNDLANDIVSIKG